MDPNKLTESTQAAIRDAQTKALRYGHQEIDVEHLLLALLEQPDGLVSSLLTRAGIDTRALATALLELLDAVEQLRGEQRACVIKPQVPAQAACARDAPRCVARKWPAVEEAERDEAPDEIGMHARLARDHVQLHPSVAAA